MSSFFRPPPVFATVRIAPPLYDRDLFLLIFLDTIATISLDRNRLHFPPNDSDLIPKIPAFARCSLTKITKRSVDAATPDDQEFFLWDEELKGFGLRVYPSGRKMYLAQFRAGRPGPPGQYRPAWRPHPQRRPDRGDEAPLRSPPRRRPRRRTRPAQGFADHEGIRPAFPRRACRGALQALHPGRIQALGDDLRIHDLRHSFASDALQLGEDLPMIGRLLGHTQVQTTARYAHLKTDPIRTAANKVADAIAQALTRPVKEKGSDAAESVPADSVGRYPLNKYPKRTDLTSTSESLPSHSKSHQFRYRSPK